MTANQAISRYRVTEHRKFRNCEAGFTLVELVMVMIILGIISAVLAIVLRGPFQMWVNLEPRTELTAAAESALQRMSREIRLALPNSIRVDSGNTIEFLRTLEGGRYRSFPPGLDPLDFSSNSDSFNVLGSTLTSFGSIVTGSGSNACLNSSADCLVVYNTGTTGNNAYSGDNIATISAAPGASSLSFTNDPGWSFPTSSPQQRFYIVDTPVSYVCNTGTGEITRYQGYSITSAQANPPAGGTSSLLTDHVQSCAFSYLNASSTRSGLVILEITLKGDNGNLVTLMQQVHVSNVP